MVDGVDLISSKRLEEAKYTYFFLTRDGLASARRARAANDPTPSSSSSSASLPSTSGPAEKGTPPPPPAPGRRPSRERRRRRRRRRDGAREGEGAPCPQSPVTGDSLPLSVSPDSTACAASDDGGVLTRASPRHLVLRFPLDSLRFRSLFARFSQLILDMVSFGV